jgi:hypothetical protein
MQKKRLGRLVLGMIRWAVFEDDWLRFAEFWDRKVLLNEDRLLSIPRGSMYGIFTYIDP